MWLHVNLCSWLCLHCRVSTWAGLVMGVDCARTGQAHIIIHTNTDTNRHAHAPTQKEKLCISWISKQWIGYIGFSYYFQGGQFWSPLHVYIGVVSSLITTDTFPLRFPVSEINRISNCLVLPHQRENMIYEISSHEKPIVRDYLLITETAQLTDKGKRGDLCWMRNILCMCEADGGTCMSVYCLLKCLCVYLK